MEHRKIHAVGCDPLRHFMVVQSLSLPNAAVLDLGYARNWMRKPDRNLTMTDGELWLNIWSANGHRIPGLEWTRRHVVNGRFLSGVSQLKPVVLLHHILHVLVGRDGDESVQVLIGELVFQAHIHKPRQFRQFGDEGREGGATVQRHYAGVAADVAQLIVEGTGEDFPAEAAHQAHRRRRLRLHGGGAAVVSVGARSRSIGAILGCKMESRRHYRALSARRMLAGVRRNQIYLQVRNQRNVPPSIWHAVLLHDHLLVLLASFRMLSGQEDVTRIIILERGIEMRALSSRVAYDVQDRVNVDGGQEDVTRMIILERGIEMRALSSRVAYDVQDRAARRCYEDDHFGAWD
nr:hypothetical protein DVH24_016637 [Ipomoea batatas]